MTEGPTATATGATPGAGATPAQAGQGGSPAGATPASGTAGTPPAPATPPTTQQPATGEGDLGEAGRRALEAERQARRDAETRAQTAEAERDQLKVATQSDAEKALTQAKREASAEERAKWQGHIRATEVKSQLRTAGLTNEKALELAARAPEFAKLKVTDEGVVEQVAETVEAFKKDYPEMFSRPTSPAPGGSWGGAEGGSTGKQPETLQDAVMDRLKAKR